MSDSFPGRRVSVWWLLSPSSAQRYGKFQGWVVGTRSDNSKTIIAYDVADVVSNRRVFAHDLNNLEFEFLSSACDEHLGSQFTDEQDALLRQLARGIRRCDRRLASTGRQESAFLWVSAACAMGRLNRKMASLSHKSNAVRNRWRSISGVYTAINRRKQPPVSRQMVAVAVQKLTSQKGNFKDICKQIYDTHGPDTLDDSIPRGYKTKTQWQRDVSAALTNNPLKFKASKETGKPPVYQLVAHVQQGRARAKRKSHKKCMDLVKAFRK